MKYLNFGALFSDDVLLEICAWIQIKMCIIYGNSFHRSSIKERLSRKVLSNQI